MVDLVDVGYNADEIKDNFDAISPNEEVLMVYPRIQKPNDLETPQHRGQECKNMSPSSMPPLETVRQRTPQCIQLDESSLASLEGKLHD